MAFSPEVNKRYRLKNLDATRQATLRWRKNNPDKYWSNLVA